MEMSTNGGPQGGLRNGFNGLNNGSNNLTNGFSGISMNGHVGNDVGINNVVPPTRPSSPEFGTTPRVLLGPMVAEAPSRHELLSSVPTAQPPFFGGIAAYTHTPLPARGSLRGRDSNGVNGHATNGTAPSTPLAQSSRYLTVPGQNGTITTTLEGLQISSCTDNMLIPTPHNTPAATPRTSPITPGRESIRRASRANPVTPPPPSGARRTPTGHTDSPYPGRRHGEHPRRQSPPSPIPETTNPIAGLQALNSNPVAPSVSPQRSTTSSDGRDDTTRAPRRLGPGIFGTPLNPTRQRGGGPKKKQKGKLANGKLTNGKAKRKGSAKDKMLDDTTLAVAHGESPIYSTNIAAILQHPEAIAVLSSAPDIDPTAITDLLANPGFKDALAAFVEIGRAGQNDPDFLEEALAASKRRAEGEFEGVLEAQFEETWAEEGGEEYSQDEEGA
ncbi:hypothetical protein ONS95_012903 [Cadophora gregata]|uniref:uncharacterized protein n=1 Tax=Cadophora gregata TaxID=51156 RepID=UPI0026DC5E54|nr:uncharacterized protein ONS95_012903 [Cadophora gregata]KAK0101114.1 hypothetical protein ONS96_006341 [Cadophora gregata f. sp. sojae]KAK0115854.1 hypothetical protein ONS95_012903 [Cadophora gregata]